MPAILVLEDDTALLDALVDRLHEVLPTLVCTPTATLEAALEALRAAQATGPAFAAMIIDLGVPGVAPETLDVLPLLHDVAPDTPIVVWTGRGEPENDVQRWNVRYYLLKGGGPQAFSDLVRVLQEILGEAPDGR